MLWSKTATKKNSGILCATYKLWGTHKPIVFHSVFLVQERSGQSSWLQGNYPDECTCIHVYYSLLSSTSRNMFLDCEFLFLTKDQVSLRCIMQAVYKTCLKYVFCMSLGKW